MSADSAALRDASRQIRQVSQNGKKNHVDHKIMSIVGPLPEKGAGAPPQLAGDAGFPASTRDVKVKSASGRRDSVTHHSPKV